MIRFAQIQRAALLAALGTAALAGYASAQLPSPSTTALGMGENFTAAARGFAATSWNPANLGVPGNPSVSFALLSPRGIAGLDPVSLADLKEYEGETVPAEIRRQWLEAIAAEGSEQGSGGADINFLSVNVGRVGLQFSSSARAVANVGPGAAELLLFGNAGRSGSPVDITLEGSSFDAVVTSTAGLSYAQPLMRSATSALAVGATVKYTFGHLAFTGVDQGGRIDADPLEVQLEFPMLVSDTVLVSDELDKGAGIGLDLGLTYATGAWNAGFVFKNLFNTFEWDEEKLFFRPGQAVFNANDNESDFDPQPFTSAPTALQDRVDSFVGQPEIAAGLAFQPTNRFLLTADFHQRLEDSVLGESKSHIGAGAELRLLSWLPIRAGGAILDNGTLGSVGAGLEFGAINLSASFAQRDTDLGMDQIVMFSFTSFRRQ